MCGLAFINNLPKSNNNTILLTNNKKDRIYEYIINNKVLNALDSPNMQKLIEKAISKAIEESFRK